MLKIVFETLTPLHISNGNDLAYNLEYVFRNNELVSKLNLNKVSKILAKQGVFNFRKNYKFDEIIKIIDENKKFFDSSCFEYEIQCEDSFISFMRSEKRNGQKIIKEFINSNGKFYIPASSIKGMLTTILDRNPEINPLGINPSNPNMNDKFVITDSDFIDSDNFIVETVQRPPSNNLITLNPGVEFTVTIRKMGNLSVKELRNKLSNYSFKQYKKAKEILLKFKNIEKKPGGATLYYNFIETFQPAFDQPDEVYLVNLGFGGGSYYKLYSSAPIPKFKNPGRHGKQEEAHTTFLSNVENNYYQLGWCKLTIEEE